MIFNKHSELEGLHSFLSPSSYHWVNYSEEKLAERYKTKMAAAKGTELHEFAAMAIRLGQRLKSNRTTIAQFVNDAIGYRMQPEQPLFYSSNAFGTTDAISFRRNLLRIHDLKSGVTPASMKQLEVYASLFCLEYRLRPGELDMELRIYQNNEIIVHNPDVDDITHIMDRIITFDKLIEKIKAEALS